MEVGPPILFDDHELDPYEVEIDIEDENEGSELEH